MDFLKLCEDYNLPVAPHGHKHQMRGWINTVCPFCTGNPGFHLGYQVSSSGSGFSCLRCGGHGGVSTISKLLRISARNAEVLIKKYGGRPYMAQTPRHREWQLSTNVTLPMGTTKLATLGKKYLERRNFDPNYLEEFYGLKETGPVGPYSHRIVIPVMYNNYIVSYTCRSYSNDPIRYKACAQNKEAIPAKDILYNIDNVPNKKKIVVVEGPADVWRLGDGAVATFGTKITASQLMFLVQFERVVLIGDNDSAGNKSHKELKARLNAFRIPVQVIPISASDPAEMDEREAKYLMRNI